jgi:transcription elongation factor GreA
MVISSPVKGLMPLREDEANIADNKISVTSPVARALIGKYEGDQVNVVTPEGTTKYEIIEVTYI